MNKLTRVQIGCSALLACAVGLPVQAARLADMDVSFNGFLTAGLVSSDNDTGQFNHSVGNEISFDLDSMVGLRIGVQIDERTSVAVQLRTSARDNEESLEVDWAYVGFELTDELEVRGGRIGFPVFMFSEVLEVGYAYPWIRPPVEVYNQVPFTSMYGADLIYRAEWADLDWTVQPFIGNEDTSTLMGLTAANAGGFGFTPGSLSVDLDVKGLYGLNVSADTGWSVFRVGYVVGSDISVTSPGLFPTVGLVQGVAGTFFNAGMTLDWNNIIAYSEFTRTKVEGLFPDSTAWYMTLGYRFGKFLPHLTYSDIDADDNSPLGANQDSVTLGMRYEVSNSSSLKVEWQRLETDSSGFGNAGISFSSDPGESVNVVSVAFDLVF